MSVVRWSNALPIERDRDAAGSTLPPVRLTLTEEEIVEITGYRRGYEQLAFFKSLGVPARRRPDGSVSVCREHYIRLGAATPPASNVESRPRLRSERGR